MASEKIEAERRRLKEECRRMVEDGAEVTLDGRPARIRGFSEDFGTVYEVNDPIRGAQWSWHAIHGILTNRGGAFTS